MRAKKKSVFLKNAEYIIVLDEKVERQLPLKIDFLKNVPKAHKRCAKGFDVEKKNLFGEKYVISRPKIEFYG